MKEHLWGNVKNTYAGRQHAVIYRNHDRAEVLQYPDFITVVVCLRC